MLYIKKKSTSIPEILVATNGILLPQAAWEHVSGRGITCVSFTCPSLTVLLGTVTTSTAPTSTLSEGCGSDTPWKVLGTWFTMVKPSARPIHSMLNTKLSRMNRPPLILEGERERERARRELNK